MEAWKSIEGYNEYEVSDQGRVRSFKKGSLRLLKLRKDGNGYSYVSLSKNGRAKVYRIHRLVILAFLPNPKSKPQCNHKNGIRNDNRLCNLEWMTNRENQQHSYKELGRKSGMFGKLGKNCPNSKTVIQLDTEGNEIARFGSGHEAGRAGFCNRAISACFRGKQKTHKGFKWKYEN